MKLRAEQGWRLLPELSVSTVIREGIMNALIHLTAFVQGMDIECYRLL
ncbi:MAG: hypothetical protein ACRD8W_07870 [Nitrososphaeraceae archaeon]